MAKIIWHTKAEEIFNGYVENAYNEFGTTTAKRWQQERKDIEWRLERHPASYPPEDLLSERSILYRRCSMMNRRFRLIYHYDEENDVVHIMDIWDSRRNPHTLIKRIK